MSAPTPAPIPYFSEADIDRALEALDHFFQDHPWQAGENSFVSDTLLRGMQRRRISLALASELIDRLQGEGVLKRRTESVPARSTRRHGLVANAPPGVF